MNYLPIQSILPLGRIFFGYIRVFYGDEVDKWMVTHGIGKVTQDGKEGIFTKLGQDHASSRVMDELWGK